MKCRLTYYVHICSVNEASIYNPCILPIYSRLMECGGSHSWSICIPFDEKAGCHLSAINTCVATIQKPPASGHSWTYGCDIIIPLLVKGGKSYGWRLLSACTHVTILLSNFPSQFWHPQQFVLFTGRASCQAFIRWSRKHLHVARNSLSFRAFHLLPRLRPHPPTTQREGKEKRKEKERKNLSNIEHW